MCGKVHFKLLNAHTCMKYIQVFPQMNNFHSQDLTPHIPARVSRSSGVEMEPNQGESTGKLTILQSSLVKKVKLIGCFTHWDLIQEGKIETEF